MSVLYQCISVEIYHYLKTAHDDDNNNENDNNHKHNNTGYVCHLGCRSTLSIQDFLAVQ
jgi:hypothetical protein